MCYYLSYNFPILCHIFLYILNANTGTIKKHGLIPRYYCSHISIYAD